MPRLARIVAACLVLSSAIQAQDRGKRNPKLPAWAGARVRLIELPAGSPLLDKVPAIPIEANEDGRFLFGRTDGFTVSTGPKGPVLTPRAGGKFIAIERPVRTKFQVFTGGKAPTALPIEFAEKDGTWTYRIPCALEVTASQGTMCFLDRDGDAWFDDLDVDGVVLGPATSKTPEVKPFTGEVRLGAQRFLAFADVDEAGLWAVSEGVRDDYVRQASVVNQLRKYASLPAVGLAEDRIAACEAHSRYCAKNGGLSHDEDPGRPGYSAEGHDAGMKSCLGHGEDAASATYDMLQTLWHRNLYLSRSLSRVGVGHMEHILTSDVLSYGDDTGGRTLVFFPPARALDVELRGANENPDPYPDGKELPGPFITVLLPPGRRPPLISGSVASRGGAPIDCATTDPTHPPAGARERFPDNDGCLVLIPRQPLAPETIYDVVIVAGTGKKDQQTFRWSFRTRRR